jgi:hypothetical protein
VRRLRRNRPAIPLVRHNWPRLRPQRSSDGHIR